MADLSAPHLPAPLVSQKQQAKTDSLKNVRHREKEEDAETEEQRSWKEECDMEEKKIAETERRIKMQIEIVQEETNILHQLEQRIQVHRDRVKYIEEQRRREEQGVISRGVGLVSEQQSGVDQLEVSEVVSGQSAHALHRSTSSSSSEALSQSTHAAMTTQPASAQQDQTAHDEQTTQEEQPTHAQEELAAHAQEEQTTQEEDVAHVQEEEEEHGQEEEVVDSRRGRSQGEHIVLCVSVTPSMPLLISNDGTIVTAR